MRSFSSSQKSQHSSKSLDLNKTVVSAVASTSEPTKAEVPSKKTKLNIIKSGALVANRIQIYKT